MGHCALGSKCNFAHTADELRPADATTTEGEDESMQSSFGGNTGTAGYPAVSQCQYVPSPCFWPAGETMQELAKVEDPVAALQCPPGLGSYHTSSQLRSMSPVRISLNSDDADGPLYVTQTGFMPKIGQSLLRSVRSAGDRLSDLGSDEPAFITPLRTIRSAGGRLSELGDSRRSQKSLAGLGHYFEGDNSSTPSCLSPRGSVHSTDHGDDLCQAESALCFDMQRKMADSLLVALREQTA